MVEIEINGLLEVLHCRIDPQLFAQGDRELLEDLVAGGDRIRPCPRETTARRRH